jgi:fumarate reductase subunit D
MNYLILQYSYLQILDLLTTVAFLVNGIHEANPFVRAMMAMSTSPIGGLVVVKVIAVALGFYCWRIGKQQLLLRINVAFAVLVAWNIVALIVGSVMGAKVA